MTPCNKNERRIYGRVWGEVHGGYFSDAKVARPLVRELCAAAIAARPDAVADLGGGTGFILGLLAGRHAFLRARLLDVDSSGTQLRACPHSRVCHTNRPIQLVSRRELLPEGSGTLLLTMRSVLHYFGAKNRQQSLLRRLRALSQPGEYFVHQTACYSDGRDAALMNDIYRRMRTEKRYFTDAQVIDMLARAGWRVEKIVPAKQIILHSDELAHRYRLSGKTVREITSAITRSRACSAVSLSESAFVGFLEYSVFVCRAA